MKNKITAKGMTWDDIILADTLDVNQLVGLEQDVARAITVELHKRLRESQRKRYEEKQPVEIKYEVCEDCEETYCRCDYRARVTIEKEFTCCPTCRKPFNEL